MPSITFNETGFDALQLYKLSEGLHGKAEYFAAREELREGILAAWKELGESYSDREQESKRLEKLKEKRPIALSPDTQTTLAEGFLRIIQDENRTDGEKIPYVAFAKKCKFSGWLRRQMKKTALKEFTESDEAVELDPEPSEAPGETAPAQH